MSKSSLILPTHKDGRPKDQRHVGGITSTDELVMQNVRFGVVQSGMQSDKFGLVGFCTNMFWDDQNNLADDDGVILLCRRVAGVGLTNITLLRRDAYKVAFDKDFLADQAWQAAYFLMQKEPDLPQVVACGSLVEKLMDDLILLAPESAAREAAIQRKRMEKAGIKVRMNGDVIVDTSK